MKEMIIQAVDIGTTKVAAIVARKTANNKVEILGVGTAPSYGVRRADVNNILKTVEAIQIAVADAEAQSGIPFTEVYVGVAGSHVKSLQHRASMMRSNYNDIITEADLDRLKNDMQKLALPPGEVIIDILAQEYIVDSIQNIIDPVGMPGSRIEGNFHIITGSQIAINNIRRSVEEAGLKVKEVIMQPLASAAAVLTDEEIQAGVVLVDIGGGTTDIAIFVEGVIGHTAVIPFGGEIITSDIQQGCNIVKTNAERLKTKHGCAIADCASPHEIITIPGVEKRAPKEISMVNLANIIQSRMEDILEYVSNEIELSGLKDRILAGLVLTGGGSKLKHIRQLTEFSTTLETRVGLPNQNLATSKVPDVDNPIFATGIGLIIKGMEKMSFAQQQEFIVKKPVDNPIIVENPKNEAPVKPVDLTIPKPEEKVTDDMVKNKVDELSNKPSISTFFKSIRDRFDHLLEGMGDDISDFKDTKDTK